MGSIDGVLTNGSVAHPKASEALNKIKDAAAPFILFTNGGGVTESARASNLSNALSHPIHANQLLQAHLPFKLRAKDYKTVLVVGGKGESCRLVAEDYGFANVFIPEDFYAANLAVSPFSTSAPPTYAKKIPEGTKIDAIFVFNDPRDWALSIQVIIDTMLLDSGKVGTQRDPGVIGRHLPLYVANPDLLWSNAYPFPRLGLGAFQRALCGAYTGFRAEWHKTPNYRPSLLGKPGPVAFRIAERMVIERLRGGDGGNGLSLEDWPLGGPTTYPNPRRLEGKGVAGKGKEAGGEGTEAGGEAKGIAGEGKEADGEGEEFDGEGEEADGEGEEVDGEGEEVDGVGEETGGDAAETTGDAAETTGDAAETTGDVAETGSDAKDSSTQDLSFQTYEKAIKRIYMIGDNPRSDILGANVYQSGRGIEWISILVKSGVYKRGHNHGAPRAIVEDVSEAVDWALENERRIEANEPLEEGPFHVAAAKKLEYPAKVRPGPSRYNRFGTRQKRAPRRPKQGGSKESKEPQDSKGPKESKESKPKPEKKES